jgi:hypothetical protein
MSTDNSPDERKCANDERLFALFPNSGEHRLQILALSKNLLAP